MNHGSKQRRKETIAQNRPSVCVANDEHACECQHQTLPSAVPDKAALSGGCLVRHDPSNRLRVSALYLYLSTSKRQCLYYPGERPNPR